MPCKYKYKNLLLIIKDGPGDPVHDAGRCGHGALRSTDRAAGHELHLALRVQEEVRPWRTPAFGQSATALGAAGVRTVAGHHAHRATGVQVRLDERLEVGQPNLGGLGRHFTGTEANVGTG
ncbi:hypothetical protein PoB_000307500 [Plakobranchus ocellatus]|uniref:Uncharacterized protein n=1 Tax=Plakobranchus ocellatus TaxID=259542 RepID=A0AAV3Y1K4_9GAST|nr:hypothetical protein PoB_000307500 [Plakobranchus ocellatus]